MTRLIWAIWLKNMDFSTRKICFCVLREFTDIFLHFTFVEKNSISAIHSHKILISSSYCHHLETIASIIKWCRIKHEWHKDGWKAEIKSFNLHIFLARWVLIFVYLIWRQSSFFWCVKITISRDIEVHKCTRERKWNWLTFIAFFFQWNMSEVQSLKMHFQRIKVKGNWSRIESNLWNFLISFTIDCDLKFSFYLQ
jgi:hypothetical protein